MIIFFYSQNRIIKILKTILRQSLENKMQRRDTFCSFYIKGFCKKGNKCNFKHDDNICKEFYFNQVCNRFGCTQLHVRCHKSKSKQNKKLIKVNTESYIPEHKAPDMQVCIYDAEEKKTIPNTHLDIDVSIVTNLFKKHKSNELYDLLLEEIKEHKGKLKLWHGKGDIEGTHLIVDDRANNWKDNCKTFQYVVNKLASYFNMDVKATRMNWYRTLGEWKPYHHDAAAIDPNKAKCQNITVGVSFGVTRNAAFQHAKKRTVISFPLRDGQVYTFGKTINVKWRHGIPQIKNGESIEKGRISIILWGKVQQKQWI